MRTRYNAGVTALGGYVPEHILTNHALEEMVDTNSEWIVTRTGIKERRIANDPAIATSDLAVKAVERLLENADLSPDAIECVIVTNTKQQD